MSAARPSLPARLLRRLTAGELRRVAHGVFTSGAAIGLGSIFNYLVVIVLSRLATKAEVGDFSYVVSTATIIATLTDFGMTNALTKAYHAASDERRDKLLAMSLVIRWTLSGLAGLVCLLTGNEDLRWVGLLLFLWPGETLLLFLNARLDFNRAGLLRVLAAVLYFGGAVGLFLAFRDPRLAAIARGLSFALVGGIIGLRVLRRRDFRGWRLREIAAYLRSGLEFFALSASSAIFGHFDVLLLAWLMTREDVGLYRPLFTLAILPTLLSTVIRIPLNAVVSSGAWTDRTKLLRTVHTLVGVVSGVSLTILALCYALAPWIIELVLGARYVSGAPIFRIVLLASVLQAVVTPYYSFIVMKGRVTVMIALAAVNVLGLVALDLVLIPAFGTTGAAWARTGVQAMGLLMTVAYFYGGFLRALPGQPGR